MRQKAHHSTSQNFTQQKLKRLKTTMKKGWKTRQAEYDRIAVCCMAMVLNNTPVGLHTKLCAARQQVLNCASAEGWGDVDIHEKLPEP